MGIGRSGLVRERMVSSSCVRGVLLRGDADDCRDCLCLGDTLIWTLLEDLWRGQCETIEAKEDDLGRGIGSRAGYGIAIVTCLDEL